MASKSSRVGAAIAAASSISFMKHAVAAAAAAGGLGGQFVELDENQESFDKLTRIASDEDNDFECNVGMEIHILCMLISGFVACRFSE